LAEAGVREITLLGQNVNAWHGVDVGRSFNLGELLHALAEIEGIERLRYTTSHPIDMDQELIDAHRTLPKLMPYLHLPVQAGSDRVLKAMNRHHTKAQYLDIIERVRAARPDMAIAGDFIVGFPGETDAEFEDTLDVIKQVHYASAFSFKYSPRPGTPGAELKNHVDPDRQAERLVEVQTLLREQQLAFNRNCLDKTIDVLVEKRGKNERQLIGRSPWLQSVVLEGNPDEIGKMVQVKIVDAGPASLKGNRLESIISAN
jgi:tRNA-2-methylthio-N6-dimethylallyladenosine synthase